MNKAVGYIRVSTKDQFENGDSPEMQEDKIRQYAKMNGLELVQLISDGGKSAFKQNVVRDGYNEVLRLVKEKSINHVIVYSLSRFARTTQGTLSAIDSMNKSGIVFHSFCEKIDTSTPTGMFFLTISAALNQLESEQTGVRIRDTKRNSKGKLKRYSSPVFGFNQSKDRKVKELTVNEQEMEIVRIIYAMNEKGISSHMIARHLNGQGFKSKTGGEFHHSTVLNILNNEIYESVV